MTRAREKLILTGCMEEPEKKLASLGLQETEAGWMGQSRELSFLALSAAGSFLDFLLPVWKGTRVVNESDLRKQDVVTAVKDSWRRQRLEEYEKEESVSTWEEAFAERRHDGACRAGLFPCGVYGSAYAALCGGGPGAS